MDTHSQKIQGKTFGLGLPQAKRYQSQSKRTETTTDDSTFAELVNREIDRIAEKEEQTNPYLRGEFK